MAVDTSREAIMLLAALFEQSHIREDQIAAETLRTLLSERDALRAAKEKAEAARDAQIAGHKRTASDCTRHLLERDTAREQLEEQIGIVRRIWQLLGNPSYEELNGRSIYDLIGDLIINLGSARAENARLQARIEAAEKVIEYAAPIVQKWGYTQGDNSEFHQSLMRPIRAWLEEKV